MAFFFCGSFENKPFDKRETHLPCRALPSSSFLLWFFSTGCQTLKSINNLEWTHCCVWLWCYPKPELVVLVWQRFWVMFISSWASTGFLSLLNKSQSQAQGPFPQYMSLYMWNCKHWAIQHNPFLTLAGSSSSCYSTEKEGKPWIFSQTAK